MTQAIKLVGKASNRKSKALKGKNVRVTSADSETMENMLAIGFDW
jgi:hypothetical protein